jgi:hypothetical protein
MLEECRLKCGNQRTINYTLCTLKFLNQNALMFFYLHIFVNLSRLEDRDSIFPEYPQFMHAAIGDVMNA